MSYGGEREAARLRKIGYVDLPELEGVPVRTEGTAVIFGDDVEVVNGDELIVTYTENVHTGEVSNATAIRRRFRRPGNPPID